MLDIDRWGELSALVLVLSLVGGLVTGLLAKEATDKGNKKLYTLLAILFGGGSLFVFGAILSAILKK